MTELLQYAQFHLLSEWITLAIVIAAIFLINRLFQLNYFNALVPAQIIFVFNAIPVIAGFFDGYLGPDKLVHFFVTEGILMAGVCGVYAFIIRQGREKHDEIGRFFSGSMPYILIAISAGLAVFIYMVTPQDGSSRIAYQTNYWYSTIKPIVAIFTPLSYFAVFVILMVHNKRTLAYTLLIVNVIGNVASGSKGAFVMQTLSTLLMIRDLGFTSKFRINRVDLLLAFTGLLGGLVLTLSRLKLTESDLWDRIMLFGEPTLMVYFAPDPTAGCRTLSLLARMHRGWGRMLGDPGALNIDTLFGYAWTIQYVGVNTFTGPNARYSSYMICNFPGPEIFFGFIMTALYLFLVCTTLRIAARRNLALPLVYAFVVTSISTVAQDFNLLMQDVNFLMTMIFLLLIAPQIGKQVERTPSSIAGLP